MNSFWVAHVSAQKITETTRLLKIYYIINMYRIYFKIVCLQTEITHQQWLSRSGSRFIERILWTSHANVYRLRSCWRKTFWVHVIIKNNVM